MSETIDTTEQSTGTALAVIGLTTPAIFEDPNKVEDLLAKLEREVLAVPRDISTEAGRDAIRSLAYKVARSKTALDDMGKTLGAEHKRKADAIDAERRKIRERCDDLKETVRKPLTEWEDAEAARVAAHENALAELVALARFPHPPSSDLVRGRIALIAPYASRAWQEFTQRAAATVADVTCSLNAQLERCEKAEADRAELERLRAEQCEREQREHDAKIAEEAAERARLDAEAKAKREAEEVAERAAAEQRRVEAEREEALARAMKSEQQRADAIRRAEEDRQRAADREAEAERKRQEEIAEAEAQRERDAEEAEARAFRQAEQAVEAERRRAADEVAARQREIAAREADENHRRTINNKAREALELFGVPPDRSRNVVTAIAKGEIPHVTIAY